MTTHPPPALTWTCEICHEHIAPSAGYIHVNLRDVAIHEKAWDEFEAKHRSDWALHIGGDAWDEFDALPEPARWHTHHEACDPAPAYNSYVIEVERATTHAHLLSWTGHLMEKVWLEHTNWADFIQDASGVDA